MQQFETFAKEHLDAAEVIRKTIDNPKKGFHKGHSQKTSHGGGNQYSSTGGRGKAQETKLIKGSQRND